MPDTVTNPISTLVVRRNDTIASTQLAETLGSSPDVMLKAISPWKIVLIRTARVFVQTLSGSVTVATFSNLLSLKGAVIIAASTAGVTALQNTAELLIKLDQSYPEFRG